MPDHSGKKRPRDINQLAAAIVDEATREDAPEPPSDPQPEKPERNPAVVECGRHGGLKGGKARVAKLTPEERSRIAREAARKRWEKQQSTYYTDAESGLQYLQYLRTRYYDPALVTYVHCGVSDDHPETQIQTVIDQLAGSGEEIELQVAVVRHGRMVIDAVGGVTDPHIGSDVSGETLVYAASTGKGVASSVAHVLVEQGTLDYDMRIVEVWPEFGAHGGLPRVVGIWLQPEPARWDPISARLDLRDGGGQTAQ